MNAGVWTENEYWGARQYLGKLVYDMIENELSVYLKAYVHVIKNEKWQ